MSRPDSYSFRRYLDAKETVDERALNQRVEGRLQAELSGVSSPLDVLEVGAGIGQTIERVLRWDVLPDRVRYTAVDVDPDLVKHARIRLGEGPFEFEDRGGTLVAERGQRHVTVDLLARDAFEFVADADREWDLLVAQSFLDLTGVRSALETLCTAPTAEGVLYCPITFDGGTILTPAIDSEFDDRVERRYHDHMDTGGDQGSEDGDSRAGRHLLTGLPDMGGEIVAAGSSDWVVVPQDGGYPADEAYFLHHIVEMIRDALAGDPALEAARFDEWVEERHQQVENGELVYIAHQLDVLGRFP